MLQHTEIIYGPLHSRRLGISLGVNLQPADAKLCTFNCIYCECGFNTVMHLLPIPRRLDFKRQLETKLKKMKNEKQQLDNITFAGNGEPTIHAQFPQIIDDTIELLNQYYPETTISVLTNTTQIHRNKVFES
jgi:wyosine [tRNA(Phe)-imidazoG37] synthetase (radical SAM superfamily)